MQYKDYIDQALLNKNESKEITNIFSKFYHFTTENIDGYFNNEYEMDNNNIYYNPKCEKINFLGKKILTVMSSGDHVLNAILAGCKDIETFDINEFTKEYLKLKIAGIKVLDLEEFKQFFYNQYHSYIFKNKKMFSRETYKKLYEYLDEDARNFWDYAYSKTGERKIGSSNLFFPNMSPQKSLEKYDTYLRKEEYYYLKETLLKEKINLSFRNVDIKNIKLEQNYDYMFLSNITSYLQYMYEKDYLENLKILIERFYKHLNNKGIVFYGYLYNADSDYGSILNNIGEVSKVIPDIKVKHFESRIGDGQEDAVLYKKRIIY